MPVVANHVTVACLSGAPLPVAPDASPEQVVDRMIAHWRERLATVLPDRPDVVVLPECCDRPDPAGYPPERQRAYLEHRGERLLEFFAGVARERRTHIAYAAHRIAPDGRTFNSTQVLDRDGNVAGVYDKSFLTLGEHDVGLTPGDGVTVIELDVGRVTPVICFDLNFEELRDGCAAARPDLLLFSSAYHGGLMQASWAYACRAFLAAAVYPPAPSGVVSPVGEVVATSTNYRHEVVTTVNLDARVLHIDHNEAAFGAVKERYGRAVTVHDPGRLGVVLLTAEHERPTAGEVVAEFGLEPLDDYFARVRARRATHARA